MSIHIGTSGWSYDHWHGVLYPPDTNRLNRLEHYIGQFATVELNSSFYRWPNISAFKSWQRRLPEGFLMSVKAPRHLSHRKLLYQPEKWIERIKSCWHLLGNKRGILLVQLSPKFDYDLARLQYFLQQVPDWLKMTIEFRHPGWHRECVFKLLEQHNVAYCIMSGAGLPCILRATASFVYVRMHGPDDQYLYAGSYSDDNLYWWADRVREWQNQGKDVFIYFNNDGAGNAVRNALTLKHFLQ